MCCGKITGLKRPNLLYATWYIGLFFDMSFSTFLIPLIQCPFMTYNLHYIHIYIYIYIYIYIPNHSYNFNVCSTWDTPKSIQENDGVEVGIQTELSYVKQIMCIVNVFTLVTPLPYCLLHTYAVGVSTKISGLGISIMLNWLQLHTKSFPFYEPQITNHKSRTTNNEPWTTNHELSNNGNLVT